MPKDVTPDDCAISLAEQKGIRAFYRHLSAGFRVDFAANALDGHSVAKRLALVSNALATSRAHGRHLDRRSLVLGFGNFCTEGQVHDMYSEFGNNSQAKTSADGVVFVLKLSLALVAYGHSFFDAETIVREVCVSLDLPSACLNLGAKPMQAQFGGGPVHLLNCERGVVFDKLAAVTQLSTCIVSRATGSVDATAALLVLDEILQRPLPYGPLAHAAAYHGVCVFAAVGVFFGTFQDAKAVAMIAPFALAASKLCQRFSRIAHMEHFLIPLAVGVVTPAVWRYIVQVEICHVTVFYLTPLLIFLPGKDMVMGAYEIKNGSIANGAGLLVSALVRCMNLALALTIGWQLFGHNASALEVEGRLGAIASHVPAEACSELSHPWWLIFGVFTIPLLFFIFVGFNMRLRDMLGPAIVGYTSLLCFGTLSFFFDEDTFVELPSVVISTACMFICATLGYLCEFQSGAPACLSFWPPLMIFAPASRAVRAILMGMQSTSPQALWGDLVLEAVSYVAGLSLAQQIWVPVLLNRHKARAHQRSLVNECFRWTREYSV